MIYQLDAHYYVRALRESDVDGPYPTWFEDQDVCRYNSHGKFFSTPATFRQYVQDSNNRDRVVWAVCHAVDGHIGNVSLQDLSFVDRTAEFAIIMGDKRHRGKGVARTAALTLLEHGFTKLNLERVSCGTAADNEGMKRLAIAIGMTPEGTRRSALFLHGERVDVLEYGILKDEFLRSRSS